MLRTASNRSGVEVIRKCLLLAWSTGVREVLKRWCTVTPYFALRIHWDTCNVHTLLFHPIVGKLPRFCEKEKETENHFSWAMFEDVWQKDRKAA
jgi:hypothetical protein